MDLYSARLDRAWEGIKSAARHLEPPRLVAIVAAAVFSAATVARSVEFPEKSIWKAGEPATWVLVATGVIAGVAAVINSVRLSRRNKRSTLAEACVQLAAYIDEECPSMALRDVGVHVWTVGGPPFARRLRRGQQFLLRTRQRSHVSFTRGKGVIGTVWENRVAFIKDLENDYQGIDTREKFAEFAEIDRLGFSWEEFVRTRKYTAVWAAPLFRGSEFDDRVVGVVSVDVQTSGVFRELERATLVRPKPELDAILAACETALSGG